jgi:hypothetical protein
MHPEELFPGSEHNESKDQLQFVSGEKQAQAEFRTTFLLFHKDQRQNTEISPKNASGSWQP